MLVSLSATATVAAGWAGVHWWAAVAGCCLIALLLFREDARVYAPPGQEASWELAETLTNILFGVVAGIASFLLGRGIGLLM